MSTGLHTLREPRGDRRDHADAPTGPTRGGRRPRRPRRAFVVAGALVLLALLVGPRLVTFVHAQARSGVRHDPSDLPRLQDGERRAALVLGAGLVGERPSPLLRDRIDAAIELLDAGRVDMLVMSGDNSTEYHDEPTVMRRYAIDQGVPVEQVAADYAGRRTWDSCARAREVFGIGSAVVVTNAFHVDRAVFTCRAAGMRTVGYSAADSRHALTDRVSWRLREVAASGRALVDAWVVRPEPAVGGEQLDPWDPCQLRDSLAPSDAERDAAAFDALDC